MFTGEFDGEFMPFILLNENGGLYLLEEDDEEKNCLFL